MDPIILHGPNADRPANDEDHDDPEPRRLALTLYAVVMMVGLSPVIVTLVAEGLHRLADWVR